MKAWRSNQDLENLIRRAEEVHRIEGDTIEEKNDVQKERKLLDDISCPLHIVLRCFYKVEVCCGLIVHPHCKKLKLKCFSGVQFFPVC